MVCVTYDYYSCNYGGTLIPREVFDSFAKRAATLLETMIRTKKEKCDREKLLQVLCEICDNLYKENGRAGIRNESVDGYQVTYDSLAVDGEILRLVRRHLGDSGMLYRGR